MWRRKVFNSLLAFDVLAPEFKLTIDGQGSVKTLLGVLLTVCWIIGLGGGTFYSFQGYFRTDSPISSSEVTQSETYPEIDLKSNSLVPIVFLYLGDTEAIEVDKFKKYISMYAVLRIWNTTVTDGVQNMVVTDSIIDSIPCSQIPDLKEAGYGYLDQSSYLVDSIKNTGMCFNVSDATKVVGKNSDELYIEIRYQIKPCILGSECAPYSEVNKLNLFFAVPQTSFLRGNLENPFLKTMNVDLLYYLNSASAQFYTSRLKKNIVMDYRGLPPSWEERTVFYDVKDVFYNLYYRDINQIVCSPDTLYTEDCGSYLEYSMQSSGAVLQFTRSYKTIIQTFAEIGGINQFVYTLIFVLYFKYNQDATKRFLLKKAYNFFDEIEKKEKDGKEKGKTKVTQKPKLSDTTKDYMKSKLCCCRKKSPAEIHHDQLVKDAVANLDKTLDITNIVSELNKLKIISHFIFKSRHFKLAPFLEFNLFRRRHVYHQLLKNSSNNKKKSKITPFQNSDESWRNNIMSDEEIKSETKPYEEALEEITKNDPSPRNDQPTLSPGEEYTFAQELDHFFRVSLVSTEQYVQQHQHLVMKNQIKPPPLETARVGESPGTTVQDRSIDHLNNSRSDHAHDEHIHAVIPGIKGLLQSVISKSPSNRKDSHSVGQSLLFKENSHREEPNNLEPNRLRDEKKFTVLKVVTKTETKPTVSDQTLFVVEDPSNQQPPQDSHKLSFP